MKKETRIQNIKEIQKQEPFGNQEIPWKDNLVPMDVYKIPLDCLVYNKYNGRILSRTKSLESQQHNIDAESDDGKALIEKLLWDSKPDRNNKTLKSITNYGQEKVGIISSDGIIIDGNRRAMLLSKSGKFTYFKAVVLPVRSDEDPFEIEKLETTYQMGEDEKLGYNPIEKYLKGDGLYKILTQKYSDKDAIEKISDWMGESTTEIRKYLFTIKTMDDYLDYLKYNGIYTQLDGREEQFIGLTKWLSNYYDEESNKAFDGYSDADVDDLKNIAFDYIRIKCRNEDFRKIGQGKRGSHFFGDKELWKHFRDFHFENVEPIQDQEENINYDAENLEAHLNARDNEFYKATMNDDGKSFMDENLSSHYQQIRFNQASNEPLKLTNNSEKALRAINQGHKSFSDPEVQSQLEKINQLTTNMLKNKSPEKLFSQVIHLLESVELNLTEPSDELFEKVVKINKISFEMKKKLGG